MPLLTHTLKLWLPCEPAKTVAITRMHLKTIYFYDLRLYRFIKCQLLDCFIKFTSKLKKKNHYKEVLATHLNVNKNISVFYYELLTIGSCSSCYLKCTLYFTYHFG